MADPATRGPVLLATDLDGTLLRPGGAVSDRTRAALARFRGPGRTLVYATARPVDAATALVRDIGVGDLVVASNGALTVEAGSGAVRRRAAIPRGSAHRFLARIEREWPGTAWATDGPAGRATSASWPAGVLDSVTVSAPAGDGGDPWCVMVLDREPALVEALARPFGLRTTSSRPGLVEVSAPGADKGLALEGILDGLAPPRPFVLAYGDGVNDLGMFAVADLRVATANADPVVRERADVVTAAHDDDGVARHLERFDAYEEVAG